MLWSTAGLVAAVVVRSLPTVTSLLVGTVLAGCCIAFANVLLPGLIKGQSHTTAGVAMGVYSSGIIVGAAVATAASVPLLRLGGIGWRAALACWALPGCGACACSALARLRIDDRGASDAVEVPWRTLLRSLLAWQITLFFAFQCVVYYGVATWLPTVFVARSVPQTTAGALVAVINLASGVVTFAVSIRALRDVNPVALTAASVGCIAAGLAPIIAGVGSMWPWVALMGLGQGGAFGLGFAFCLLRSNSSTSATALAGMSQTISYLLSGVGPVALGVLHELVGGWGVPLAAAGGLLAPTLAFGLAAARSKASVP